MMMTVTAARAQAKPWKKSECSEASELVARRQARSHESELPQRTEGFLRDLYRTELLSKDEERILFERMDELRAHAAELRVMAVDLQCKASARDLKEIEKEIGLLRNHLVESNLRLVFSVARKFQNPEANEFHELVSEGNSILLKAVDLFQVKYGYRFSTYATTALRRGLNNYCNSAYRRKTRFVDGHGEHLNGVEDDRAVELISVQNWNAIRASLKSLDKRERKIVVDRFGLEKGMKGKTFREIGEEFNLSKERIRQIVYVALDKMRANLESHPDR